MTKHRHEKAAILAILHEIQEEDKQLETESLNYIAQLLKVPVANVYGLATFYSAFSLWKKGDTEIRVCDGISCHIKGSDKIIGALKSHLNVEIGETTWDKKFSLEKVNCLGLCAIAPNASFNGEAHSQLNIEKILEILKERIKDSE
ncbi:MAG: NAD(P)H-dependent oxidoreductase subunit E [Pseudomonadota bacterium]